MCTVTFLPLGKVGFTLTSNRDEHVDRPLAEAPRRHCLSNQTVVFPRDPQAHGTWIAMAEKSRCLCLLNGAFEDHVPKPVYRKSRGWIILDYFQYPTLDAFLARYDFRDIAPFTFLVLQSAGARSLVEIRWDGETVYCTPKDANKPHIWSSATLYSPDVRLVRERWYANYLESKSLRTGEDMLHFHRVTGKDDPINGLCINRDQVLRTVNITSVTAHDNGEQIMTYEDLVNKTVQCYRLM